MQKRSKLAYLDPVMATQAGRPAVACKYSYKLKQLKAWMHMDTCIIRKPVQQYN